jgi:hypothetical protein
MNFLQPTHSFHLTFFTALLLPFAATGAETLHVNPRGLIPFTGLG